VDVSRSRSLSVRRRSVSEVRGLAKRQIPALQCPAADAPPAELLVDEIVSASR
jgi:hypothetical protein